MAKKTLESDIVSEDVAVENTPEATKESFADLFARASLPFDNTFKRPGPGGVQLEYITGEQCLSRVQAVYGPYDWSVNDVKVLNDAAVVYGTLTVQVNGEWVRRDGVGTKMIEGRNNPENALKAAETNALKRAAAKFGVGLYLYEKDEADVPAFPTQGNFRAAPTNLAPVNFSGNNSTGSGTTGPIEAISQPSVGPDGRQRLGGLKVNGQWYNVTQNRPLNVNQYQRGQVITIAHAPGKTFIDGISIPGGEEVDESNDF